MITTALSCGNSRYATRPDRDDVRWFDLPARPAREDVDPLLADLPGHVVVHGTDADLAAVVLRLLRKTRVADVAVGYVPVVESPVSRLWGIPVGALDLAVDGRARPTPLIRDDSGGVLLASGVIEPITGQVYCDDQRILNGSGLAVEVSPDPGAVPLPEPTTDPIATEPPVATDGLRAVAVRRRVPWSRLLGRRREVARGRAVQASFQEASVVHDGVAHPRPVRKWAWYRHTEDLMLVRP